MTPEQFLPNEPEVLIRLKAGDHAAFEELYNHYNEHARKLVYSFLHNINETEEVLQNSWLQIHRYLARFQADRPFWPYFYVVFRRQMRDYVRNDVTNKKYVTFYDFTTDWQFADKETPEDWVLAAEAIREFKPKKKSKTLNGHGLNKYKNHGCRCDFCRAANRECNRSYYLRVGWKTQKARREKALVA